MHKVKAGLRLLVIVVFLILAAFGLGMTGAFLNNDRGRYMNNEIRIETIDKRDDEEEEAELKR